MVSSIAIPIIIGVIIAVVTPKGTSQSTITRTNKANGIRFGSKTKSAILERFTKTNRHRKAAKKAAKNEFNWVFTMNLFNCV